MNVAGATLCVGVSRRQHKLCISENAKGTKKKPETDVNHLN